ncbi:hypothetical protein [Pedobacter sp. SYP-B3415]|uniref:hypothetical protein n=1 Tax=Pedobacter sp. SYP-B3415 TaxID=2496641 RepID=UPI00101C3B90|nr:hypothetical protein [Pedobacter sp. SYP-B3415]
MNRGPKNIRNTSQRTLAVLLLLIFVLLTGIRGLHYHDSVHKPAASELSYAVADSCDVCDFLGHHNFKDFDLPPALLMPEVPALPSGVPAGSYIGIYKFTLQGFSNKGPPCPLSFSA